MKARLRFALKPYFNQSGSVLVCPARLVGRAHDRDGWTMVFTVTKQVSALVFDGDLKWLIAPAEQDFGRGVKFQMISYGDRKRPLEGKDGDRREQLLQEKLAGRARAQAEQNDEFIEEDEESSEDIIEHIVDDVPPQGIFATGELLG